MKEQEWLKERVVEAIKHCKVNQCDECPFKGKGSYCVTILQHLLEGESR